MPRGGGRGGKKAGKPRRPAHQNSFAFKHNKHSKKTKFIAGLPTTREQGSGLCKKCSAIIEWRKFYRKYKPLREAHKCASCGDRKVTLAYHVICSDCAYDANICPKCRTKPEVVDTGKEDGELDEDQVLEVLSSASLKQRQRRTIMRKFENGTLDIEELQKILGDTSVGDDEEDEDDDEPEEKPEDDGDADAPAAAEEDEDVSPEGLERKALKEAERDADLDTSHPGDWTVFDEKYDEVKHEAIMAARFTARVEAQMKAYRAAAANERAAAAAKKKDEKGGDDDDEEEDGDDAEEGEEEDAEEGEEDADEEEADDDDGEGEGDEDDEAAEEGEDEGEDEENDDSGRGAAAAAVPAAKGKKQLEPIAGVRFKASIANKLNAGEDHLRKINAQSKHDKDKGRMQHGASHTHAAMKAKAAANTKK